MVSRSSHKDAGFTPYFDTTTNTVTADAATALTQLDGKNACWTEPTFSFRVCHSQAVFDGCWCKDQENCIPDQSPPGCGRSVFVCKRFVPANICDFGATYIDARTDKSLAIYTDVIEKVMVIWRSDPFIPNDNVSLAADLPDEVKAKITEALLTLGTSEDGVEILNRSTPPRPSPSPCTNGAVNPLQIEQGRTAGSRLPLSVCGRPRRAVQR